MSGLTAIVCDDDPQARSSTCALVATCGFEVVAELDLAVSAVSVAELLEPTVVLIDASLPGLSSLQAVPMLRAAAPGVDVIVCTTFETVRPSALNAGASEVVDKGDDETLEQLLRQIAERRRAPEAATQ